MRMDMVLKIEMDMIQWKIMKNDNGVTMDMIMEK